MNCVRYGGVKEAKTTFYNARANSKVERNNKDLADTLRSLLMGGPQEDWDELLPHIMHVVRATAHCVTGETANYMMYGR